MSESSKLLLRQFSEEIVALTDRVVRSTATVSGMTHELEDGGGSAWLYDAEHLVTNYHVVGNLVEPIHVELPAGPQLLALVTGSDPQTDLAVLRVDPQPTPPLQISEKPARLGEICFAFGCPLGQFPQSLSIGIVSGLERRLRGGANREIFDVIQTDAAINPGNSGGPLVNTEGLVIGVNTAGIDGAEGIGFAVPAQTVTEIVNELINFGSIERASLGITVTRRAVEGAPGGHALVITALRANKAGPFELGDALLSIGEREIRSQNDLLRTLRRDIANRKVNVVVLRDGHEVSLECLPRSVGT